jgi:hypothetical protein
MEKVFPECHALALGEGDYFPESWLLALGEGTSSLSASSLALGEGPSPSAFVGTRGTIFIFFCFFAPFFCEAFPHYLKLLAQI